MRPRTRMDTCIGRRTNGAATRAAEPRSGDRRAERYAASGIGRRGLVTGDGAQVRRGCRRQDVHREVCRHFGGGGALQPINATSHWLWGERAMHQHGTNMRYTATGYLIHHGSSLLWASVYERWFAPRTSTMANATTNAVVVSALAAATDYLLTPKRLTPGFERHLTLGSMVLVYGAFAAGMAAARRTLDRASSVRSN